MAKVDGRSEILKAVSASPLRWDQRAKHAYKLPGVDHWRLDLGGARSARLEEKFHDAWRGVSDPLYYGHVKTVEFAQQWVDWAVKTIQTGGRAGREPKPIPTSREVQQKVQRKAKEAAKHEREHGRGFYVTNVNAAGGFKPRIAEHGPYRSLDEAVAKAWDVYTGFVDTRFDYLLPVAVVEAGSRGEAERGGGYVWWADGRKKGAPVDPRQTSMFANKRGRPSSQPRRRSR